jgi:DNA-directed RNA polymerase subunit M/transcription elongation factor TFIIS
MDEFICPKCGNRAMTKKGTEDGTYKLICSKCGFQYETLPQEDERGFV